MGSRSRCRGGLACQRPDRSGGQRQAAPTLLGALLSVPEKTQGPRLPVFLLRAAGSIPREAGVSGSMFPLRS
ncbi:hypothetical protein GSbR_09710 [Geobacter sp. SVR]|nr:hypothetical protein GSbR_09710 [Geobacter sp. SVR]